MSALMVCECEASDSNICGYLEKNSIASSQSLTIQLVSFLQNYLILCAASRIMYQAGSSSPPPIIVIFCFLSANRFLKKKETQLSCVIQATDIIFSLCLLENSKCDFLRLFIFKSFQEHQQIHMNAVFLYHILEKVTDMKMLKFKLKILQL